MSLLQVCEANWKYNANYELPMLPPELQSSISKKEERDIYGFVTLCWTNTDLYMEWEGGIYTFTIITRFDKVPPCKRDEVWTR
jgi:hypothetical protein